MASLSISRAWDETKARIAADGRLMLIVAAALVALPVMLTGVVAPGESLGSGSLRNGLILLVASLVAIIGQLAIIRMALGTSVSVGEAIGHGARRMPIYFVAGVLVIIGLVIALVPFIALMAGAGVPMEERAIVQSPAAIAILLLYFLFVCFIGVRLLMSSPVASEEAVGPVAILRRSWELTAGNWWRLFAFLVLFLIGAGILMAAIGWTASIAAVMLLGEIEPMSASALVVALVEAIVQAVVTLVLAVMLARIYVQLAGGHALDVSVPKSGT